MRPLLLPVLAAAAVNACGGGGGEETEPTVPFETVASTQHSGFGSGEHVTLRTAAALDELWARMAVGAAPAPPVDFAALQVVGVFLGSRSDGCHGVAISGVTRTAGSLVVSYRETAAPPGVACTQAMVTPAHLVAVPSSPLPVEFQAE